MKHFGHFSDINRNTFVYDRNFVCKCLPRWSDYQIPIGYVDIMQLFEFPEIMVADVISINLENNPQL